MLLLLLQRCRYTGTAPTNRQCACYANTLSSSTDVLLLLLVATTPSYPSIWRYPATPLAAAAATATAPPPQQQQQQQLWLLLPHPGGPVAD
jgi:hypothetical protein